MATYSQGPYDSYPPGGSNAQPMYNMNASSATVGGNGGMKGDDPRMLNRTPSPTPSEAAELRRGGVFDWQAMKNWRFWIRREWLWYYVAVILITTLTALITIYHSQIVGWLKPVATWMRDLKFGFLIPIAILFVLSFPPLFGHEIIAVLCGLVWGLGEGFAIVAAGTFIGELGNFYTFKYLCRARGEKLEKTEISYACLAKIVRDGGFKIALVARLSAIPGHFTTAVFSTCGMHVITFAIAAVLSLPKQFVTVYLGVMLEQSDNGGTVPLRSRLINYAVVAVTTIITILAMWYIYHKMNAVKPQVIYERRKARQAKMFANASAFDSSATLSDGAFNPAAGGDIPLDRYGYAGSPYGHAAAPGPEHQQWDKSGRAVGYAGDPRMAESGVYAPSPVRAASIPGLSSAAGAGAAYPAYGHGRAPSAASSEQSTGEHSEHGSTEALIPTAGAGAGSYAPPRGPPISVSPTARAPSSGPLSAVYEQTPTQAQFASFAPPSGPPPHLQLQMQQQQYQQQYGQQQQQQQQQYGQQYGQQQQPLRRDSELASPQLATPTYASAPAGSFAIGHGAAPVPATQTLPQPYGGSAHVQDASDASYYTASDSHSREGTDSTIDAPGGLPYPGSGAGGPGAGADAGRTFSPAPPSYRTTAPGQAR